MQNAEYRIIILHFNSTFCISVSGWQDSNLRPPAPKAGAISRATLHPEKVIKGYLNILNVLILTSLFSQLNPLITQ